MPASGQFLTASIEIPKLNNKLSNRNLNLTIMADPTFKEKTSYCDSVPCTIHDHSGWLDRLNEPAETHICTESPCPIEDKNLIERLMNSSGTIYTKTPLEQFNEQVMKEIPDHVICGHCNVKPTMENFITQKLTEHKELILKMVREKIFEDTNYDYKLWIESEKYRWHQGGRKELREEFLNNLDTI